MSKQQLTLLSWLSLAISAVALDLSLPNKHPETLPHWDIVTPWAASYGACLIETLLLICVMALVAFCYVKKSKAHRFTHNSAQTYEAEFRKLEQWTLRVGVATIALLVLVTWGLFTAKSGLLRADVLPAPMSVYFAFGDQFSVFLHAALHSTVRLIVAFSLSIIFGTIGGIVVGRIGAARYLTPYARMLAVLPPLVLTPLFIYLFSPVIVEGVAGEAIRDKIPSILYEETFRIATVSFAAFWAIFSGALHASLNTKRELIQVAEGLGYGPFRKVRAVVLPMALPQIFRHAGLGLTVGFIVLLSVEGSGARIDTQGLGAVISQYDAANGLAGLYALIVLVTFLITAFHWVLDNINRYATPWENSGEQILQKDPEDVSPAIIKECTQKLIRTRKIYPINQKTISLSDVHINKSCRAILSIDRNLETLSGELIAIIGESGSGKTTLSRVIAGFDIADRGEVVVNDLNLTPKRGAVRKSVTPGVAFMFQDYALMPHLTVEQNLHLVLRGRHEDVKGGMEKISNIIRLVRLDHCRRRYPNTLSGGEQQRVALARALLMDEPILIIDEGLSSIDQPSKSLLRAAVRQVTKALNLTTLYISHDREDVLQVADRIWYLKNGRVIADDTPREMYYHSSSLEAATFLGHTNLFEATLDGRTLVLKGRAGSVQAMASASFELPSSAKVFQDTPIPAGQPVLICIPKKWILVGTSETDGLMEVEGLVEEAVFSGTEWELRIRVAGGTEFDVVMQDGDYQRLLAELADGIATNTKAHMAVKDAWIVGAPKK